MSIHTNLTDKPRDLMVGFRSSPYGSLSHAYACQNGFNILYGGALLFRDTGYYIAMADDLALNWYKHTRRHNSVLLDGKGQTKGAEGFGWIARLLHGRRIRYCLGDASNAYGDTVLVRFRRQILLLRPFTVVIYDDLETDHPVEWSWLLHSGWKMTANARLQRLRTVERTARGQVDLLGPPQLAVDDRFDPPVINWSRRQYEGKTPGEFPRQWHATVSPAERCERMRVLAVIQVRAADDPSAYDDPVVEKEGWVRVGPWWIQAELDVSRGVGLEVRHQDGKAVLAADRSSVRQTRYRTGRPNGSILDGSLGSGAAGFEVRR